MMTSPQPRILPDWLQEIKNEISIEKCDFKEEKNEITQSTSEIIKDETTEVTTTVVTRRYNTRARSNSTVPSTIEITKRRRSTSIEFKPRQPVAFIQYNGKVEYYTEFHDIASASAQLLNWVNKQETNEMIPIGFDMEWPFTFQTGPGRTAVIQLCANVELCYIFHVSEIKKLPAALVILLTHDKVLLHGVNIKNDCRKLERDYAEINSQKMINQCIDLGVYCNKVCNTGGRWSMERLVWYLCRLKINKDKKVRNSKWHIQPLSYEQQIYAAIDVYIAQVMYIKLKQRELEKDIETKKFIAEFGAAAYAAKQKLI